MKILFQFCIWASLLQFTYFLFTNPEIVKTQTLVVACLAIFISFFVALYFSVTQRQYMHFPLVLAGFAFISLCTMYEIRYAMVYTIIYYGFVIGLLFYYVNPRLFLQKSDRY
jgi:hypothetical protein